MGLLSWLGSRRSGGQRGWVRRRAEPVTEYVASWEETVSERDMRTEQMKRDAAADVAAMQEDARYFRRPDPEDDL
jgi:hypothetical protein